MNPQPAQEGDRLATAHPRSAIEDDRFVNRPEFVDMSGNLSEGNISGTLGVAHFKFKRLSDINDEWFRLLE